MVVDMVPYRLTKRKVDLTNSKLKRRTPTVNYSVVIIRLKAPPIVAAMLTELLEWLMQSVLHRSPTPASRITCRASPASNVWVTATSTDAAPAASSQQQTRRARDGVAGAGHIVQQHHLTARHRNPGKCHMHRPVAMPNFAARGVVKAMA